MIQWTYQLEFDSPFGIFSGFSVAGLVDRMVVRNHIGMPVVPGSSVKGRWRFFAERILRAQSNDTTGNIFLHAPDKPACKQGGRICTVCKWFGSPSIAGGLQVGPADLNKINDQDWKAIFRQLLQDTAATIVRPDTEIRPGIALSRSFRTALRDHLFFDETVPPVDFQGFIRLNRTPTPEESRFLKGTAALVDRLGARKAVGRGRLTGGIRINGGDA